MYIRGKRQAKALFTFIEQVWLFVIGRDTRDLDYWDLQNCVYSGWGFMKNRFKCAMRELEIFFGIAKPYGIRTTSMFNDQYRTRFGDQALLNFLIKAEQDNEFVSGKEIK